MQLEIFVQDLIRRCALSAASCYMERCIANAFCHLMKKGPQLPGLPRNCADKKCLLEMRPFEHGIAKTSQNCQIPTIHFTCSPTQPTLQKDRGKEQQKPKRKESNRK